MTKKTFILISTLILSISVINSYAQQATVSAGGNAADEGGILSYSIGQVFCTSCIGVTHNLVQGVQQPYEISVITSIEEANEVRLEFGVYPNPTKDYIKLDLGDYPLKKIDVFLFNSNGNLILTKKLNSQITIIQMHFLLPAIYFLKITDNNKEIKTFKIIKN